MKTISFYSVKERTPKNGEDVILLNIKSEMNLFTSAVTSYGRVEYNLLEVDEHTGEPNGVIVDYSYSKMKSGKYKLEITVDEITLDDSTHYCTKKDWFAQAMRTYGG